MLARVAEDRSGGESVLQPPAVHHWDDNSFVLADPGRLCDGDGALHVTVGRDEKKVQGLHPDGLVHSTGRDSFIGVSRLEV